MKRTKYLAAAITLLGLFFLFTAIVLTVDLKAIGPNTSVVGLSSINGAFDNAIGYNDFWYELSELVGLIPLAMVGIFAILGVCQAIKRKSLFKIDIELIILGAFYVAVFATYMIFEVVEVNYRPVLLGVLEASYPSSHTILSLCICTTAIFELHELLKNKKTILLIADIFCAAVAITVLVGRLLSGVHWLTDIIAGILISASLICFYRYAVLLAQNIKEKAKAKKDAEIQVNEENTIND